MVKFCLYCGRFPIASDFCDRRCVEGERLAAVAREAGKISREYAEGMREVRIIEDRADAEVKLGLLKIAQTNG